MLKNNRMPKGVLSIQIIQALSTFSFAIIFSSLTLYIVNQLGLSQTIANSVMGSFLAFNFVLHLLGGMLGGTYLSNRKLFLVTTVMQTIGLGLLTIVSTKFLYIGLSLFLIGCGINTTCLNTMLTERFSTNDTRREKAFFINYSAMNAGFFAGYMFSGFFDGGNEYQNLFWIGFIVNLVTIIFIFLAWGSLKDRVELTSSNNIINKRVFTYIGLFCLVPIIIFCLQHSDLSNHLVMTISVLTIGIIFIISFRQKQKIDTQKIHAFLILTITSIIFWMIYYTGPMGITLFIKNNVDRNIGTFTVATQWVSNINSIVIIGGAPLVAVLIDKMKAKGFNITITKQFIGSFVFLAASFYCLSLGILSSNAQGYTNLSWLIVHIILQGLGELLIGPVGYAMIGKIAPKNLQSILMGTWMMVSGVSASLSHYFSNMMVKSNAINPIITNIDYYHVFNQLGLWALLGAIVLLVLSSMLNRHIEKEGETIEVLDSEEVLV